MSMSSWLQTARIWAIWLLAWNAIVTDGIVLSDFAKKITTASDSPRFQN